MARSASAIVLLAAALMLGGCVTTQQRNERAKLTAKRLLASREPLRLGAPAGDVGVGHVTLIRGRAHSAFVVEVVNRGARPAADVPLEVGVVARGARTVLNGGGGLDYFASHVASIAPRSTARWVFVTARKLPREARAFAIAGAPDTTLPGRPRADLPVVTAVATRRSRVTVRNRGAVPQYRLPVYVIARRGGRYVAAGRATLRHLGSHATTTVALPLVGAKYGAALEPEVLPSTFR